ncbi:unnamed protein product [Caenorhabditis auriculariae]|uniref:Uncharacterized protein n=1 Tax=Caenorhabditis auriculariae TaxID=2777116 RepID=A0A8S1H256_9PELO|nr:unnamed protein product [Caenorhabditis auriculariae]
MGELERGGGRAELALRRQANHRLRRRSLTEGVTGPVRDESGRELLGPIGCATVPIHTYMATHGLLLLGSWRKVEQP